MKTLAKYTFLLIFVSVTGLLVYQNLDYFMTKNSLSLHIEKILFSWTGPEIENAIYYAVCLLFGLFLSGTKGLFVKWDLNKKIRQKDATIKEQENKIFDLKTRLEVFTHDPYIKKGIENKTTDKPAVLDSDAEVIPADTQSSTPDSEE